MVVGAVVLAIFGLYFEGVATRPSLGIEEVGVNAPYAFLVPSQSSQGGYELEGDSTDS
ncbi:hypothetical protein HS1genome_1725 [Sulfodiicoccus acidiphilus]|uniref:Uncharacterized protein n=2 Tax=Sulfodiicoccus acidiphilus TaxID=1670455 RepID=A0A348B584_9CREN|nr:hypothetical protein HS1genome_1725 [Sulfodiicoccus acidiphilus]GGT89010.1 hypothetical protein GCM10007116_03540 [Sulfodiicoccus acidiphilus]